MFATVTDSADAMPLRLGFAKAAFSVMHIVSLFFRHGPVEPTLPLARNSSHTV